MERATDSRVTVGDTGTLYILAHDTSRVGGDTLCTNILAEDTGTGIVP